MLFVSAQSQILTTRRHGDPPPAVTVEILRAQRVDWQPSGPASSPGAGPWCFRVSSVLLFSSQLALAQFTQQGPTLVGGGLIKHDALSRARVNQPDDVYLGLEAAYDEPGGSSTGGRFAQLRENPTFSTGPGGVGGGFAPGSVLVPDPAHPGMVKVDPRALERAGRSPSGLGGGAPLNYPPGLDDKYPPGFGRYDLPLAVPPPLTLEQKNQLKKRRAEEAKQREEAEQLHRDHEDRTPDGGYLGYVQEPAKPAKRVVGPTAYALSTAYASYQDVKRCFDIREGYAMIYVSVPEMEKARDAIKQIERALKPRLDSDITIDTIWSDVAEMKRTFVQGRGWCQYRLSGLLQALRQQVPESGRIEKDF